jgi:hypothetical protein
MHSYTTKTHTQTHTHTPNADHPPIVWPDGGYSDTLNHTHKYHVLRYYTFPQAGTRPILYCEYTHLLVWEGLPPVGKYIIHDMCVCGLRY